MSSQQCPFNDNCTNQFCTRVHDNRKACRFGTKCRYTLPGSYKRCTFIHSTGNSSSINPPEKNLCRYDEKGCTDQFCWRQHENRIDCKFGLECRFRNSQVKKCTFIHPQESLKEVPPFHGSPPSSAKREQEEVNCKYGENCSNQFCWSKHEKRKECRYGLECRFRNSKEMKCTFMHPQLRIPPKEVGISPTGSPKKENMCRYGGKCSDQFCTYNHDLRKECTDGIDCKFKNSQIKKCTFMHPKKVKISPTGSPKTENMCRYKVCTNQFCKYNHVLRKECTYGLECRFRNSQVKKCTFLHHEIEKKHDEEEKSINDLFQELTNQSSSIREKIQELQTEIQTIGIDIKNAMNLVYLEKRKSDLERRKQILSLFYRFDVCINESLSKYNPELIPNNERLKNIIRRECDRFTNRLPVLGSREGILNYQNYDVLIFQGTTGSGKSTQIGQYFMDRDLDKNIRMICTQPRDLVVQTLSQRVEEEFGEKGVIFNSLDEEENNKNKNRLVFTTDKLLLNKIVENESMISDYDVVMIDEAHERSLETDILLAFLRTIVIKRKGSFKVVISSATMDVDTFSSFFNNRNEDDGNHIIRVRKVIGKERLYPLKIRYNSIESEYCGNRISFLSRHISKILKENLLAKRGHVLCFLKGNSEVIEVWKKLMNDDEIRKNFFIHALTEKTPPEKQREVFLRSKRNKLILGTKIAETSITIPGIRIVIDSGRVREMYYSEESSSTLDRDEWISKARAEQRAGRAGRTSFGEVFRLYTETEYDFFEEYNIPEIKRSHLGLSILKILKFGVCPLERFKFIENPSKKVLKKSLKTLVDLEAINEQDDKKLTDLGVFMSCMPFSPLLSKMLMLGIQKKVVEEISEIVAFLSVGESVFEKNDATKLELAVPEFPHDDLLIICNILNLFREEEEEEKKEEFLTKYHLKLETIKLIESTKTRILSRVEKYRDSTSTSSPKIDPLKLYTMLHEIIIDCLHTNVCISTDYGEFWNLRINETVVPVNSSLLSIKKKNSDDLLIPKVVLCYKLIKSGHHSIMKILIPVIEEKKILDIYSRKKESSKSYEEYFAKLSLMLERKDMKSIIKQRFTKIGSSLLSEHIIGKTGNKKQLFQKKFQCSLLIDEKKNEVITFSQKNIKKEVEEYLEKGRDILREESFQRLVSGEIRARVGVGGEVSNFLLQEEYDGFDFLIHFPTKSVSRDSDKYGFSYKTEDWKKMVYNELLKDGKISQYQAKVEKNGLILRGYVRFKNKNKKLGESEAVNSFERFKNKKTIPLYGSDTKIEVWVNKEGYHQNLIRKKEVVSSSLSSSSLPPPHPSSQSSIPPIQSVEVEKQGNRRIVFRCFPHSSQLQGFGFIRFSNEIQLGEFREKAKMTSQSFSGKGGSKWSVGVLNPLGLNNFKLGGTGHNIHSVKFSFGSFLNQINEWLICKWVRNIVGIRGFEFGRVNLPRKKNFQQQQDFTLEQFKEIMDFCGEVETINILKRKIRMMRCVFVEFKNHKDAIKVFQNLEMIKSRLNSDIHIEYDKSTVITINRKAFRIMEEEFEKFKTKKLKQFPNLKISKFGLSQICIYDYNGNLALQRKISQQLQNLFNGTRTFISNCFIFMTYDEGRRFIEDLERREKIILKLRFENNNMMKIICPYRKLENITTEIEKFVDEFTKKRPIEENIIKLDYMSKHIYQNIIRDEWMKKEDFFIKMLQSGGKTKETRICVKGGHEQIQIFEKEIKEAIRLEEKKEEENEGEQEEEEEIEEEEEEEIECMVCYDDVSKEEEGYELVSCCCVFCRNCVKDLFKHKVRDRSFPITCPSCCKPVVIRDIFNILDDSELDELIESSVSFFKNKNSKIYKPCPTPDCKSVFTQQKKDLDTPFHCSECDNKFCRKCCLSHIGYTCEEFSMSTNTQLLIEKLKELGMRSCPKCNEMIEKNGGCNHVTCVKCFSHICWKCTPPMRYFSTGGECYSHLSASHGGCFDY